MDNRSIAYTCDILSLDFSFIFLSSSSSNFDVFFFLVHVDVDRCLSKFSTGLLSRSVWFSLVLLSTSNFMNWTALK